MDERELGFYERDAKDTLDVVGNIQHLKANLDGLERIKQVKFYDDRGYLIFKSDVGLLTDDLKREYQKLAQERIDTLEKRLEGLWKEQK